MDNPIGHIGWYAVLETKRLLLRPNTKATWITTHQIENLYHTIHVYFICNINRAYRPLCEHMRAFPYDASACAANERIRIASHRMWTHFWCVMCAFAYVIWTSSASVMRAYARIRVRCARIRMRCARRMRAFKGNLCVSGTVSYGIYCIRRLRCQKQVSQAGISNCIRLYSVEYNFLSLAEIPALWYQSPHKLWDVLHDLSRPVQSDYRACCFR